MTQPHAVRLLIGYGNELRGDDALGPRTAEAIAALDWPNLRTLTCHQLLPELAETIAQAALVIFVDASVEAQDPVATRRVRPEPAPGGMTHVCSPGGLLELSQAAYGRHPDAWWVTLAAHSLAFGTELSPPSRALIPSAIQIIQQLCQVGPCTKQVS